MLVFVFSSVFTPCRTPRKKARIDDATPHLSAPHGVRYFLTTNHSAKSPRSPRARPSTPRTPATSRAKPKQKTTTPRTELTAAVPLVLQPLGRHNDQRASVPTSSTFTVRSPTYGSRALLGRECTLSARPLYEHLLTSSDSDISRRHVSTSCLSDGTALTSSPRLDAAKSSPTPSSSVLSPSSTWRESSRSPSTSSRSPVFPSHSALGSPGAASSSTQG